MVHAETLVPLAMMCIVNTLGTLSIAFAAKGHGWPHLLTGVVLYVFGAWLMYEILRNGGEVGMWGPVSAIVGLILITVAGNFFFGEVITVLRVLGLVLAAIAIVLIALSAAGVRP